MPLLLTKVLMKLHFELYHGGCLQFGVIASSLNNSL